MKTTSILDSLSFDQLNLEAHAREPSHPRYELNGVNRFYGNGDYIRQYAELPEDEPLPFSVEHFVPLEYDTPKSYDMESGLPLFLAAHEKRSDVYSKHGVQGVAFGSGIHYALQLLRKKASWKEPEEKRGTIAFPHKSTSKMNRSFDYSAFADWLIALPKEYQPVVVCIAWRDYLAGKHLAYIEREIPVVSCGNQRDPEFLFRFIDLCTRFKYSCGNGIGSSYPFSVLCGCHFFYQDFDGVSEKENDDTVRLLATPGATSDFGAKLMNLAPFPPDPNLLIKQQELSNYLTGKKHLHRPQQIQELFRWSHQWLLERQGVSHACNPATKLSLFSTWLPNRVYSDGWAESNCRIILKPSQHARTFKAYLEFAPWHINEPQDLQIKIGSSTENNFNCAPAYYELTLPLATENEIPIHFELSAKKELSADDHREVSFRFLGWEVTNDATTTTSCVPMNPDEFPQFIQSTAPQIQTQDHQ